LVDLPYAVEASISNNQTALRDYIKRVAALEPSLKATMKIDTNGIAKITFSKPMGELSDINLLS
jgi:hypothetical protein